MPILDQWIRNMKRKLNMPSFDTAATLPIECIFERLLDIDKDTNYTESLNAAGGTFILYLD